MIFSLFHKVQRHKDENYGKYYRVNNHGPRPLSERQYHILFFIHYLNICTPAEIGVVMRSSPSSVSLAASKMVKNGYILKNYDVSGDDKRKISFTLTPDGEAALNALTDEMLGEMELFYKSLTPWQQGEFDEALRLFLLAFPEVERIQVSGQVMQNAP